METIIKFIITVALAALLIALLPASPFPAMLEAINEVSWIGYINYFIPVNKLIVITTAWLGAVGTYFLVSWVLRQLDIVGA